MPGRGGERGAELGGHGRGEGVGIARRERALRAGQQAAEHQALPHEDHETSAMKLLAMRQ